MITLDNITTPAQARRTRQPKGYVPEPRPEGGWTFLDTPDLDPDLYPPDDDHVAMMTAGLERIDAIDAEMLVIEKRAHILLDKLTDAALLAEYDSEHPVRLNAEERLSGYLQSLAKLRVELMHVAYDVQSRGRRLPLTEVDAIGSTLVRDSGALGRVWSDCGGIVHLTTWQRLFAAAVPF